MNNHLMDVTEVLGLAAIIAVAIGVVVYFVKNRFTEGVFDWRKKKATIKADKPPEKDTDATMQRSKLGDKTDVQITGKTNADLTDVRTGKEVNIKIGGSAPIPKAKRKD